LDSFLEFSVNKLDAEKLKVFWSLADSKTQGGKKSPRYFFKSLNILNKILKT
jgi:hypothetical protein